jgi:ACT domain-containing protein
LEAKNTFSVKNAVKKPGKFGFFVGISRATYYRYTSETKKDAVC